MAIQRWIPTPMRRRRRDWPELDIESMLTDFFRPSAWPARFTGETGMWSPDIDISERDNEIVIRADLPGMDKDNLQLDVTDSELMLKGQRKEEERFREEESYCTERWYGSFERRIGLPSPVSSENVKASFQNGVLEIHLPKTEESGRKRIEIQS